MKKNYIKTILLIILFVFLDQLSKLLISKLLIENTGFVIINNFFKIFYIKNTGAAFGIFSNNLIFLIIITILLMIYLFKELKNNKDKLTKLSITLIISGAFGNLIDRIFRKYVVDFISFTLLGREMAIFNIADIFVTCGVVLFLITMLKDGKNERSSNK